MTGESAGRQLLSPGAGAKAETPKLYVASLFFHLVMGDHDNAFRCVLRGTRFTTCHVIGAIFTQLSALLWHH